MPPAGRPAGAPWEQALSELAAEPLELSLYRTAWLPERGYPDPLHTEPSTNRFGSGAGTIYTASTATVAWAETCRNRSSEIEGSNPLGVTRVTLDEIHRFAATPVSRLVPMRALYRLDFSFDRAVDLRSDRARQVLETAGVDEADLVADDYGRCRDLATVAVALGWDAILVPSAAWTAGDGYCVPVFKPHGALKMTRAELLAEAALPTLAVAYLTRYPAGARPSWLP